MIVGYARTSTSDQKAGLEAQERDLKAIGIERIFHEQTSSIGPRRALEEALGFLREGDVLVVTKLDRLARSVADLGQIVSKLKDKAVSLRILNLGLDTSKPTGKLMLNLLGSIAQFEREIMLERQREGIAKAKSAGKYRGRKPTAQAKASEILAFAAKGKTKKAIADELAIGVASVYRVLKSKSLHLTSTSISRT
jgi:DNA invertase Pin-like site-specific DNA recombinase